MNEATFMLLRRRKFCLCIEDTDEKPRDDIISTAPWGYLRLRKDDYSGSELRDWAGRIKSRRWEKTFVFFKHEGDVEARGPALAMKFRGLFS